MRKTTRGRVADLVTELAEPLAEQHGLELVDVEYVREGGSWYVRVYIDKPGGIDHNDCQIISNALSDRLDELDPIPQAYYLEVSSPGVERPLKKESDFVRFQGERIAVHCYKAIEGRKKWHGTLIGLTPEGIELETETGRIVVPQAAVARAHLLFEPNRPAGGRKKK